MPPERSKTMAKKICAPHSDRDRVVAVATPDGKLDFYYQPVRSNEHLWLLQMPFSGSVFAYFRDHGCNIGNIASRGYSLTLQEMYKFNKYKNPKLSRLFSRLPSSIEYVLKYETEQVLEAPIMKSLYNSSFEKLLKQTNYVNYEDRVA